MKEVFLSVSESSACCFFPDKIESVMHVSLEGEFVAPDAAKRIKEKLGLDLRGKKLVLAANFKKTLVRIVDVNEFKFKRGRFRRKIADCDAWEVVKSVFPIGPNINEETHLFDISLFGDKKYVCFGLPVDLCERLAELGKELTGSLHRVSRLEAIENLIFAMHHDEDKIIVFPQDDGLRLLTVKDGLPENVFFVSNNKGRREAEFEQILAGLSDRRKICMSSFIPFGANDDLGWVSKYI